MSAITPNSLASFEPDRVHTLSFIQSLVHIQAEQWLDSSPWQISKDNYTALGAILKRLGAKPATQVSRFFDARGRDQNNARAQQPQTPHRRHQGGAEQAHTPRAVDQNQQQEREQSQARQAPRRSQRLLERQQPRTPPRAHPRPEREQPAPPRRSERMRNQGRAFTLAEVERGRPRTRQGSQERPSLPVFDDILPEDTLCDLSSHLQYRLNCLKQATRYNKPLGDPLDECEFFDVHEWHTENMRTGVPFAPWSRSLKWSILSRLEGLIKGADLFEPIPEAGQGWGVEEKGIAYLAIALVEKLGWEDAHKGLKAEDLVMGLVAEKKEILKGNIYHAISCLNYLAGRKKEREDNPASQLSQPIAELDSSTVVVRGGFENCTSIVAK